MALNYLNAAGHGLPDRTVLRRMIAHLDLEAMVGPLAAIEQVERELAGVRNSAAVLLNAETENIGFDSGTVSAWRAYVAGLNIKGKRLLVAPHEWGENIASLAALAANAGARIEALPALDLAVPDLSTWQSRIDDDVAALFFPMVTSVAGLRYPVEAIGALQLPTGTQIIVDAAQAIGQTGVNVRSLGCDAVFATTRKWVRGPRETAIFWTADPKHRAAIERLDTHVALRLGLGVALDQLLNRTVEGTAEALGVLSTKIRERAAEQGLACHSTTATGTTAVTLAISKDKENDIASALKSADIVVKWPNPSKDEPLSSVDVTENSLLRLAPHLQTTLSDIDAAFDVIAGTL